MSSEEEDFNSYGTALEEIEEDEVIRKRPKTLEHQVAKDKFGTRRFHGAFTGGFSAGYFNSVGSRDGWTPTAFKSSRSCKADAEKHVQKPEHFMDDEDTDEFGIAPKVLRLQGNYDDVAGKLSRKRKKEYSDGPIPGVPVLQMLFQPVRSSVGVRMLKRMGWRVGQGVGPRLSKTEKKAQKERLTVKVYGCSLPSRVPEIADDSVVNSEDDTDTDDEDVTFAPDDYDPYFIKTKDNYFGIGYSGLDRKPILSSHINLFEPEFTVKEKSKKFSIRGQGFGVGALEEEDDDIYSHEDMSQYDFSLGAAPSTSSSTRTRTHFSITASQITIEGFVAARDVVRKKYFPPPKIPQGFQAVHRVRKSRSEVAEARVQRHEMTAKERAQLIVDEPKATVAAPNHSTAIEGGEIQIQPPPPNHLLQTTPNEEGATNSSSLTATTAFKPFVNNSEKQKRYVEYLKLVKCNQRDKLSSLQPLSMTEWERERERVEFDQAERLYRPLSAAFSDRFVSASQPDDATNPLSQVQRTLDDRNDLREAAKRKLFGKLTRKVYSWSPASLLCKRFNVRQPDSVNDSRPVDKKRPKFSAFNFLEAATMNAFKKPSDTGESSNVLTVPNEISLQASVPQVKIEESEEKLESSGNISLEQEDETSEYVDMNKQDLYRAIFLSSDESEEESELEKNEEGERKTVDSTGEYEKNVQSAAPASSGQSGSASSLNILRNTSPPRGIFANLDFDLINSAKSQSSKCQVAPQTIVSAVAESDVVSLCYGPKLPDTTKREPPSECHRAAAAIPSSEVVKSSSASESSDEWIESDKRSRKKRKVKKKKHKKHKRHKKRSH